jgi:chromosome segregation ATPase
MQQSDQKANTSNIHPSMPPDYVKNAIQHTTEASQELQRKMIEAMQALATWENNSKVTLQQKYDQIRKENMEQKQTIKALREDLGRLKLETYEVKEREKYNFNASKFTGDYEKLHEANKELMETNKNLEEQNSELMETNKNLEEQNSELMETNKNLEKQNKELVKTNKILDQRIMQVCMTNEELKEKLYNSKEKLDEALEKKAEHEQVIQNLNQKLEELQKNPPLNQGKFQEKYQELLKRYKKLNVAATGVIRKYNKMKEMYEKLQKKEKQATSASQSSEH